MRLIERIKRYGEFVLKTLDAAVKQVVELILAREPQQRAQLVDVNVRNGWI